MHAKRGKRILMLVENRPYPDDPRVRSEAAALAGAGYHVSVIAPSNSRQRWTECVDRVHVYRYPPPAPGHGFAGYLWEYGYSLAATWLLALVVLIREGFDVIHAANPPDFYFIIAAFFKLLGKRFVYDHHDLAPEMYRALFGERAKPLVYRALVVCEQLSCRLADGIIATNESYKTIEMERDGVPADRIRIVRNGPDLARLAAVVPDPHLRQNGRTMIGYVGVMGYQDGVDRLLRALRHLCGDLGRTDFLCVLVGTGDAWQELVRLAAQLEIGPYVRFTGWISDEDLVRYLSTVDICVDPDPANAFTDRSTMVKMMEYMAFGKPIVAFDLKEHRVTAQGAAVYVPPNDEYEFARAIARLMDDPARRQAMGALGRRRVETELAWPHSVPPLLGAYARLLPNGRDAE